MYNQKRETKGLVWSGKNGNTLAIAFTCSLPYHAWDWASNILIFHVLFCFQSSPYLFWPNIFGIVSFLMNCNKWLLRGNRAQEYYNCFPSFFPVHSYLSQLSTGWFEAGQGSILNSSHELLGYLYLCWHTLGFMCIFPFSYIALNVYIT